MTMNRTSATAKKPTCQKGALECAAALFCQTGEQEREGERIHAVAEIENEAFHAEQRRALVGLRHAVQEAADGETHEAEQHHQEHRRQQPAHGHAGTSNNRPAKAASPQSASVVVGVKRRFTFAARAGTNQFPTAIARADQAEGPAGNADETVVFTVERGEVPGDGVDEQRA